MCTYAMHPLLLCCHLSDDFGPTTTRRQQQQQQQDLSLSHSLALVTPGKSHTSYAMQQPTYKIQYSAQLITLHKKDTRSMADA